MTTYYVVEQDEVAPIRIYKTAYAVKTMKEKIADVMGDIEEYMATREKPIKAVDIDDKIEEYIVTREPVRKKREEIRNVVIRKLHTERL